MKIRIFLFLLLMVSATCHADDATITIKQKSGNETVLELSFNPVITFSGEDMVITSDLTTISIPLDDVDSYTVDEPTSTGIEAPTSYPNQTSQLVFRGINLGTEAHVYTIDGRMISKQKADDSGDLKVCLDQLPKGTYIISAGKKQIKVFNK